MHWNGKVQSETELEALMTQSAAQQPLPELQLKVDQQVDYGQVAKVMAMASRHGLHKLAFVSTPESE